MTTRAPGRAAVQGTVRPLALAREGRRSALAQPVATATTALVVALVCGVVLLTTGRTAVVEQNVVSAVDSVGTRLITVVDVSGDAVIDPSAARVLSALEGVTWAFGLGPASDVSAMADPGGLAGVAMRDYVGELPAEIVLTRGRLPQRPGEAVVGMGASSRLGLTDGLGPVNAGDHSIGVVGEFGTQGPMRGLDDVVLRQGDGSTPGLRYVYVLAASAMVVPDVSRAIAASLPATDPSAVRVETSEGVLDLREVIAGAVGAGSRQVMAAVLGFGLLVVAVTVHAAVSARRRDFGRRRALGASRSAVVALVLLQTGVAALIGIVVGTAAGLVALAVSSGGLPAPSFVIGLAALALLVALTGSVAPAVAAARRDPVRVLRVP